VLLLQNELCSQGRKPAVNVAGTESARTAEKNLVPQKIEFWGTLQQNVTVKILKKYLGIGGRPPPTLDEHTSAH